MCASSFIRSCTRVCAFVCEARVVRVILTLYFPHPGTTLCVYVSFIMDAKVDKKFGEYEVAT